jgi:hypothetical protein
LTDVFFHIGLHKTATTWFQKQFFPSLDGVHVLHTRHVTKIPNPGADGATLIVSHAGLSAKLSVKKTPGTNTQWLVQNLRAIREWAPNSAIVVGFREHSSWLEAAYCNKAKKTWGMSREAYLGTFSHRDLSWCQTLQAIDESFESVFPFLYEELVRAPLPLIDDLCKFINKTPPENLSQLLNVRRNPSPRSEVGQFVSRSLYALSAASRRQLLKSYCGPLGAKFDRYFTVPAFKLDTELRQQLNQDWSELIKVIGKRRGRDLSPLLQSIAVEQA